MRTLLSQTLLGSANRKSSEKFPIRGQDAFQKRDRDRGTEQAAFLFLHHHVDRGGQTPRGERRWLWALLGHHSRPLLLARGPLGSPRGEPSRGANDGSNGCDALPGHQLGEARLLFLGAGHAVRRRDAEHRVPEGPDSLRRGRRERCLARGYVAVPGGPESVARAQADQHRVLRQELHDGDAVPEVSQHPPLGEHEGPAFWGGAARGTRSSPTPASPAKTSCGSSIC